MSPLCCATVEVAALDTIKAVKTKIGEKEGIAAHEQLLKFAGRELKDSETVASCGIEKECAVYVSPWMGLRGGVGGAWCPCWGSRSRVATETVAQEDTGSAIEPASTGAGAGGESEPHVSDPSQFPQSFPHPSFPPSLLTASGQTSQ